YFRDKEDLRLAISRRVVDIVVAELLPPLRTGKTANEIIGGTLDALTVWVEAHPRLYDFLRQRWTSGAPALGEVAATMADQLAAPRRGPRRDQRPLPLVRAGRRRPGCAGTGRRGSAHCHAAHAAGRGCHTAHRRRPVGALPCRRIRGAAVPCDDGPAGR